MKRPRILITNDDGIQAPGIFHLWEALSSFADVTIVAPLLEQSCSGLSVTIRSPLKIEKFPWPSNKDTYSVTGTPADCVKLALHFILNSPPDMVVSGINRGTNAGRNVLYSGTVAGAIEASLHNIPAIAFSCQDYINTDYKGASKHIPKIIEHSLAHPLAPGTLLNINFPSKEIDFQGFKMTQQGKEYWGEDPQERFHPAEGHAYYWIGAKMISCEEEEDSDISWLNKGYGTAVPINVGALTDHRHLQKHRHHFESFLA